MLESWKFLANARWFTVQNLDQLVCTGSSTHKLLQYEPGCQMQRKKKKKKKILNDFDKTSHVTSYL